jgi:hypothetical protein
MVTVKAATSRLLRAAPIYSGSALNICVIRP